MSDSFSTPWTVAHRAPLSMGFSRQEYWSGLSFPSLRDLADPGIEPSSALPGRVFKLRHQGTRRIRKYQPPNWHSGCLAAGRIFQRKQEGHQMEKKWTSATELKIFKRARRFVRNILTVFLFFFSFYYRSIWVLHDKPNYLKAFLVVIK